MRALTTSFFLLVLSWAGVDPLAAQGLTPDAFDVTRTACGVWREDGTLCGGGPDYRVVFGTAGFEFVPALSEAPRLHPTRFSLLSILRGGRELELERDAAATADGWTVGYARGGGIVERYDLGPTGVEQSFVFPRRPAGPGDLVVRQRLTTDLLADAIGDCSEGFVLHVPGRTELGGIAIGRAVAIDANGARYDAAMSFDGVHLELRLAGEIVDTAAYPLVLDPPISTTFLITTTAGDINPDVAWDESTGHYLVVWNRRLSSLSSEIRGQLLDDRGRPVGSLLAIETAGGLAVEPTVGNLAARDRFCVVWQEAATPFGNWNLFGRSVEAGSGAMSGRVQVTRRAGNNDIEPDLASAADAGSTGVLLTWLREGDGVRVVHIGLPVTGNPTVATGRLVQGGTGVTAPAISKGGGATGTHVVVWSDGGVGIGARAVGPTGIPIGASLSIDSNVFVRGRDRPDVDGDGRDFMVVYERGELGTGLADVYCRPLRFAGGNLSTVAALSVAIEGHINDDEILPAVGYVGGKYIAAFADRAAFLDYDIIMQELAMDGTPCGTRFRVRNTSIAYDAYPEIATQLSGGGTGDEALCVFSVMNNTNLASAIRGQLFEGYVSGSATNVGGACGSGGTIAARGAVAAGNERFAIDLQGADPQAPVAAFLAGLPGASSPCGSCTLVDPLVTVILPLSNGAARFPFPLPCSLTSAVGARLDVQWVALGTAQSPCPSVSSLSASDRLRLTLGQ